jgi:hypothetical protein
LRESRARRNWVVRTVRREVEYSEGFEDEYLQSYNGTHKKLGIRFFGNREAIIKVEASLPRVLFGHNSRLIVSQSEINAALRKLDRKLSYISHPPEEDREYTRVDLVWHVPGSCADFILAHRDVRHPLVRKATCVYDKESITWGGSSFRLVLYDKTKKELGSQGDFVRVEAQLRGRSLDQFLYDQNNVLEFTKCYQYLRKLVFQLEPPEVASVTGIVSLLAACKRMPAPPNEVHPVEVYLLTRSSRRQRDLRRQLADVSIERRGVNWRLLLPEDPPKSPPQMDVPFV